MCKIVFFWRGAREVSEWNNCAYRVFAFGDEERVWARIVLMANLLDFVAYSNCSGVTSSGTVNGTVSGAPQHASRRVSLAS